MQETIPEGMNEAAAVKAELMRTEFFNAKTPEALEAKMDRRLDKLKDRGEVLLRRTRIEPDRIPAVMSELTKNIVEALNKGQRRRLKKQARKLLEAL